MAGFQEQGDKYCTFHGGSTKSISKVIQMCGSQGLREWWGSSESVARWGRPALEFCLISWPLAGGFPSPKGNLSFALSLRIFALLGSDKNKVSLCLQSLLRFLGETLRNSSSTHYKCGLSYKACGSYLSKMPLIHWELDPGKNAWCYVWLTFLSVLSNRKKKMYKTTDMIFYLIDWELLVHADPVLVLTAAGKPPVSKAPQSMKCWWGSKCEFRELRRASFWWFFLLAREITGSYCRCLW